MKNEILRQKKIARNKKRAKQRKKEHPERPGMTHQEHNLIVKSFFVAGSRHGARKFRKTARQEIADIIKKKNPLNKLAHEMGLK